jgi:hypothetical protein
MALAPCGEGGAKPSAEADVSSDGGIRSSAPAAPSAAAIAPATTPRGASWKHWVLIVAGLFFVLWISGGFALLALFLSDD